MEDKVELTDKRIYDQGKIEEREIKIGEYAIENIHFERMMYYFINGGFVGWGKDKPSFIEPAISAIKNSDNPLFKNLRKNL